MSTNPNTLRVEDVHIRKVVRPHKDNNAFIGYARATLVIPEALPDGNDMKLHIRDLQVKILNGKPRLDFKSVKVGNDWIPLLFPKNGATRNELTRLVFESDVVLTAIGEATEELAASA